MLSYGVGGCGIDLIVIWISCAWYYFVVSLVAGLFICLCGCYVSLVFSGCGGFVSWLFLMSVIDCGWSWYLDAVGLCCSCVAFAGW